LVEWERRKAVVSFKQIRSSSFKTNERVPKWVEWEDRNSKSTSCPAGRRVNDVMLLKAHSIPFSFTTHSSVSADNEANSIPA
jgi:hypothetical protein